MDSQFAYISPNVNDMSENKKGDRNTFKTKPHDLMIENKNLFFFHNMYLLLVA